jgi:hypothetical protein
MLLLNTNAMPYSLRKRITERIANANLKGPSTERERSSPDAGRVSDDNSQPKLMQDPQNKESPPRHAPHVITPSAPIHDKSSIHNESSKKSSPLEVLLDGHKNREAPPVMAKPHATRSNGKDESFSEDFNDESSAVASEWTDVPATPYYPSEEDMRVLGVNFEMMRKKGQAAEAPKLAADDDVFHDERQRTGSRTRRSQRADSAEATDTPKLQVSDDLLKPPALTIKKVNDTTSRTPSPQEPSIAGSIAPTPSNSPNASALPNRLNITKNRSETRPPDSPDPLEKAGTPIYRCLRPKVENATDTSRPTDIFPPTLVLPPIYRPDIPPLEVWCSPLSCTSRPEIRWGWMKKWVCCKCASQDPSRRGPPVITMVEQKVCSRLACQHVRCARGCTMMGYDTRFDEVSSFN